MMEMSFFGIAKIELVKVFADNCNSRTIRITSVKGEEVEIALYGETDALDTLPRSDDFREVPKKGAA